MESEFLTWLEAVGYTSPATLVNRFGASNFSIANSFAIMGPSYILDKEFEKTCVQLLVFARTQFLRDTSSKGRFLPLFDQTSDEWVSAKKDHPYNEAFNEMGECKFENLFDDLRNPDFIMEADCLLKSMRNQVRTWIRGVDKVTLQPTTEDTQKLYVAPAKLPPIDEEEKQSSWERYSEAITGGKSESPLGYDWARMKRQESVKTPQTSQPTPMASMEEMLSLKKA